MKDRFPACQLAYGMFNKEAMDIHVVIGSDNEVLLPKRQTNSAIPGEKLALYSSKFAPHSLLGGRAFNLAPDPWGVMKRRSVNNKRAAGPQIETQVVGGAGQGAGARAPPHIEDSESARSSSAALSIFRLHPAQRYHSCYAQKGGAMVGSD
jgi:hypothetical protein